MNRECWELNTLSNSPEAPGTKSKFGKERVHHEVLSKSVRLMSVVLVRQNSRKDHMRRLCTKKDAPANQRGIWRKKHFQSQEFGQRYVLYSWLSLGNAGAHFEETRRARNRCRTRSIVAHDEQKRIKLRRDGHSKEVQNPYSGVDGKRWSAHPRGGTSVRS